MRNSFQLIFIDLSCSKFYRFCLFTISLISSLSLFGTTGPYLANKL